jgi:homoserine dehydrogenase
MSKQLTIGLFGFGCVGQGLYEVLNKSVRFKADFKKICIKHPDKKRILNADLFTIDKWELLNDPEINTIVELIDDPAEAYLIITSALKNKKNVVTANKKVLAENLEEFIRLQQENEVSLIYEASACGRNSDHPDIGRIL